MDVVFSLGLIFISPLLIWFYDRKSKFIRNLFEVLLSKKSLVGYQLEQAEESAQFVLPNLKKGILPVQNWSISLKTIPSDKLNVLYARDYSPIIDLKIIFQNLFKLDL